MVKNILTLLASRQSSILSSATILMFAVFTTKFLGLIKDRLLVHKFTTPEASVYFAAFALPDLLFQLLVFGAISVAFIPIFTEVMNKKGSSEAFELASNVLNLLLVLFGIVAIFSFIFVEPLNNLLVPGFSGQQKELTDLLTRIILFAQIILVVGSFFISFAQSFQHFLIPALAPIFYNIGIIIGIGVLSNFFGIVGTAYGVVIGALLHVLVQLPLIKSLGFKYKLSFNLLDGGVREMFKLISIRNLGLVVEQINERVGFALATLISPASPTLLTFAQHLHVVPIGLFGATIAQAALPVLSREQAKNEIQSFKITLLTTMHQILFLTLPAAAILIVLRIPVVRLVFGASQFGWEDTVLTGRTVMFLALGLAAQSVVLLFVRAFYALKDTKTPVLISLLTVGINIFLSLLLIMVLKQEVWSLGLAYAASSNLYFILLLYFLNKKVEGFSLKSLFLPLSKMLLAALVAAIALYIPIKALDQLVFDTTKTINLIVLTGIAASFGLSIYLILVWLLEVKELQTFVELLRKVGRLQSKVETKEVVVESEASGSSRL